MEEPWPRVLWLRVTVCQRHRKTCDLPTQLQTGSINISGSCSGRDPPSTVDDGDGVGSLHVCHWHGTE